VTTRGWAFLHGIWIAISVARAGADELVWRNASDRPWAIYNAVSDVLWVIVFVLATYLTAHRHWKGQA
jgi:intracellular septation protein